MTSPARFQAADTGVAWRRTGDEIVVLDIGQSTYFGLNASAARLWLALQDGATRDELVRELMSGPAVDADRAEADVDAFLLMLEQRRLVSSF